MSPMTPALISYWHRLPAESPSVRRERLQTTRDRVCAGMEPAAALVPFALGDVDAGIVAEGTRAWIAAAADATSRSTAVAEAAEWIRRGLALNRGAVFGALLDLEDAEALEHLGGLRLSLSAAEVEVACDVAGTTAQARTRAFIAGWIELLDEGPTDRERRALTTLLDAAAVARAA